MSRLQVDRENKSFFDPTNDQTSKALLQAQYDPSNPAQPQLRRATDPLVPDHRIERRLDHFPDDLYDLRPESHLSRFLHALMGDSGAGSVRKRFLVTRLQSALQGTHFFDLDRFYGAIFGAQRFTVEQVPINPYTDVATQDEWEDIQAKDTSYRERLMSLTKAIPMGATPAGLKAAAEAITGVECEVYESWQGIDYARVHGYRLPGAALSWEDVTAIIPSWDDADGVPYFDISYPDGIEQAQDLATFPGDRAEVIIRVKKRYDGTPESMREQAEDEYALRQVLNRLKPANVLLTLDTTTVNNHEALVPADCYADSNYYEVVSRVSAYVSGTTDLSAVYPVSAVQARQGVLPTDEHVIPRPPFTKNQGASWSYNNEVVSIKGSVQDELGVQIASQNIEFVTDSRGQVVIYSPDKGVLDARQVEASRLASDGILVASPYAADRRLVSTHD